MVNLKQYTGIDWYQNISFHWSNQYSLRYEIDSLDPKSSIKPCRKVASLMLSITSMYLAYSLIMQ